MKPKPKTKPQRSAGANQPDRQGEKQGRHADAAQRTRRPGPAGLANEARPGLGTRADRGDSKPEEGRPLRTGRPRAQKAAKTYREPTPPPQEEPADEMIREQEHSTGVSGQSAGT